MPEWMKVDRDILINAKVMAGGRLVVGLYLTVLGLNKSGDRDGHLLPLESAAEFLAFRSGGFRLTADEAKEALEACLRVNLLSLAQDGGILIYGWDETWKPPLSEAERSALQRKRRRKADLDDDIGERHDDAGHASRQESRQAVTPDVTGVTSSPSLPPINPSNPPTATDARADAAPDVVAVEVAPPVAEKREGPSEEWWTTACAKFGVLTDPPMLKSIAGSRLTPEEFAIIAPQAESPNLLAHTLRKGRPAIDAALVNAKRKQERSTPPPVDHAKREAIYEQSKKDLLVQLARESPQAFSLGGRKPL